MLFMLGGLQMAAPVSAAKLIDHGSYSYYEDQSHQILKTTWKTYQYNKNYIIIKIKNYVDNNLDYTEKITLKKVSNRKLKSVYEIQSKFKDEDGMMSYSYSKTTQYKKYSSSARKYYYSGLRSSFFNTIH